MLWVTWRQQRVELIGLVAGAVGVAIVTVLATGYATRVRADLGIDGCVPFASGPCFDLANQWRTRIGLLTYLYPALYVVPGLIASYIGGPLIAREIERGTHRLGWTQGISRTRWTGTLIGIVLAFAALGGIVLALVGGQTRALVLTSEVRPWDSFDVEGPALVAFMAFGIAIAAFIGAWRRRILGGMFWGLVAFALVRIGVAAELRPSYEPPIAITQTWDTTLSMVRVARYRKPE
jgi:hypothetical protein